VLRAYQQLEDICSARGIAQELQWAAPFRDRALVEMGHVERGVAQMGESLQAHTITRSALLRPYYLVLYAGALLRAGQLDDAQRALDESAQCARDTVQHAYDAEHARLQAEVFSARDRTDAAEESHRRGLGIAHTQGARWLELRSARAYANFLAGAGRVAEARAVLEATYASISEGHQAFDMVAAEALLKTLNQP
jgi:predicted ATPase